MPDTRLRLGLRHLPTGVMAALASVPLAMAVLTPAVAASAATAHQWLEISAGSRHTCAVRADHTLWCWGDDQYGELGAGFLRNRVSSPVQVGADADWAQVSASSGNSQFTCAVKTDHTLWCWGLNNNGQLGNSLPDLQAVPVLASRRADWAQVSAGNQYACAVKTDHSLWCWGDNASGQLGLGAAGGGDRYAPARVGAGFVWAQVSAGFDYACAIRTGGTLWCWGDNSAGELGVHSTVSSAAPARVKGTGWQEVSAGRDTTCAVRGQMFCWGDNDSGQLGIGYVGGIRRIPVIVGESYDWTQVAAGGQSACAIKADSSLWCWGDNTYGQLGTGSRTGHDVPAQVGTATWGQITAGGYHTCAIESDATAWCWGSDDWGDLGTGSRSSDVPVQIG